MTPATSPAPALAGAFLRSHLLPHRIQATLRMTPMIDVVFLLIIFFMCSQFRTHEGELLAKLPPRDGIVQGAEVRDEPTPETVRIYVSRTAAGVRYVLNGAPLAAPDRLYPALAALRQRRPDLQAILDGDDDLHFQHFLLAFNECLRAGIARVSLVRPKVPTPEDGT